MKMFVKVFVFILLISLGVGVAGAAPDKGKIKHTGRHIIRRTAAVLIVAQQSAQEGQKFSGLGLAVAHHRYSCLLFNQGNYEDAIYHSLRARFLGAYVIKQNKSELLQDALYDRFEEEFAAKSPPGDELDKRLPDKGKDDKAAAYENIDFGEGD